MPRKDFTLSCKIALLDKIKSQPLNTSHRKLAEITGVSKSTIARFIQQENQLRKEWESQKGHIRTFKRKRLGKHPKVEEALDRWFSVACERGINISGPVLKAKSTDIARELGHKDFKATDGWLSRWKARHNIKFKKGQVEIIEANDIIADNYFSVHDFAIPEMLNIEESKNNEELSTTDDDLPCSKDVSFDDVKPNFDPLAPVTSKEAKRCIDILRRYFVQEDDRDSPMSALNVCANFVEEQIYNNKR